MTNHATSNNELLPPGKTLRLYSPSSLATNHPKLLAPLTTLINLCYSVGHTSSPHRNLLPYSTLRLPTDTSLVEEVGNEGFIFILSFQDSEKGEGAMIASASAKPFKELGFDELALGREMLTHFKRRAAAPSTLPTVPGSELAGGPPAANQETVAALLERKELPKWEIICNVVHPDYQRKGIAGLLYDALVKEMRRRESPDGDQDVHLVITTMKELNEVYYQKRGFVTTAEKRFDKGVGGSETGFSVVEMEKIV